MRFRSRSVPARRSAGACLAAMLAPAALVGPATAAAGRCTGEEVGPATLILLDRTGSMDVTPPGWDATICAEAQLVAIAETIVLETLEPEATVAPWIFRDTSGIPLAGFVSPADARLALVAASVCEGPAPLATAICQSVQELVERGCPGPGEPRRLLLVTDGDDESVTGPCAGPPSEPPSGSGDYTPGSWHQQVYDAVVESGVELVVWYFEDTPDPPGPEWETSSDRVFFADLAHASGGYLKYTEWGEAPPELVGACCVDDGTCLVDRTVFACVEAGGHFAGLGSTCLQCPGACPGDLDGDGRVDAGDLLILLAAWGGDDPAADLDGSGVVDAGDLLLLLAGWGPCDG